MGSGGRVNVSTPIFPWISPTLQKGGLLIKDDKNYDTQDTQTFI